MKNEQFFKALCRLAEQVLPLIQEKVSTAYYLSRLKDYPEIAYKDSPFPEISTYSEKPDIANFFNKGYNGRKPDIDLSDYSDFNQMMAELMAIPEFVSYNSIPDEEDQAILKMKSEFFIRDAITAYYYRFGTILEIAKLKEIYEPLENYIFAKDLIFDIAIPILFVTFEAEQFNINDNIYLRRISDETHKAKHHLRSYSPPVADALIRSASHELVLKNYTVKKPDNFFTFSIFGESQVYPNQLFQKFFIALKVATDHTSGYAQVVVHPHDWASDYHIDLMPLKGTSVKHYPSYFDDFYWTNKSFAHINDDELQTISDLFNKILTNKENKLEIALRRFYKSMMRQEDEDIIIDLVIALEILLSDNEKSEITYKLALRITTLLSKFQSGADETGTIFNNVKKIYEYRSAVAHGSHKAGQKREIKLPDETTVKAVLLAKEYLREILKIILDQPQYLSSKEIDLLILKGE